METYFKAMTTESKSSQKLLSIRRTVAFDCVFKLSYIGCLRLTMTLGVTIELDKHWNDNSSIRSDLRVNRRWRKLMYDNYEGRKQTSQLFRTFV